MRSSRKHQELGALLGAFTKSDHPRAPIDPPARVRGTPVFTREEVARINEHLGHHVLTAAPEP